MTVQYKLIIVCPSINACVSVSVRVCVCICLCMCLHAVHAGPESAVLDWYGPEADQDIG